MVGHSANMALRRARGNNQKISDFSFAGEFDDDGIFGLIVLESCFHLIEEVLNQWRDLDVCYVYAPFAQYSELTAPLLAADFGGR